MKKIIKMSKEEAVKFFNSSNDQGFKDLLEDNFGKGFAKPKEISDIVYNLDTLEEYCDKNNISFNLPFEKQTSSLEKTINATYILAKVAEVYNQGKQAKFDGGTYYYMPYKYFHAGGGSAVNVSYGWGYSLYAPGCLFYINSKLSKASYKNFKQYWEYYWEQ